MLRDIRRLVAPELDAFAERVDVRSRSLRVTCYRGRNTASDYALLARGAPLFQRRRRPSVTVVLEGSGRIEEGGRRAWLGSGSVALTHERHGATEAYAGRVTTCLLVGWDPEVLDAEIAGTFRVDRVAERDRVRLLDAARALSGPRASDAALDVVAVLRSLGLPFARLSRDDIAREVSLRDEVLQAAIGARLSRLVEHPAVEDVAASLRRDPRSVRRDVRSMSDRYALPWKDWRSALHAARFLGALQLLAAPGATTEIVARLTGFRAPTALCHAFAKAGLPSPGVFARAARRDVLDAWTAFASA